MPASLHQAGRRLAVLAGVLLWGSSVGVATAANMSSRASPGVTACRLSEPGVSQGPCASPDAVAFLPGPLPVALTNFGLLYPAEGGTRWDVVCDDNFGLAPPDRTRRSPDGRIFAASNEGLFASADGCTFTTAGGAIAGKIVFDAAFDAQDPMRMWAVGDLPRKLWASTDGGRSFVMQQAFVDQLTFSRVVSAPSDARRLYLFGRGTQGTSPSAVSLDGGQTVTTFDLVSRASPRPPNAFDFLAISPTDPLTLYFSSVDGTGDELWKTTDGGATVRRVLKLEGMEALTGFAFGDTPELLYVAGTSTDIVPAPGQPPARLYVSRDGGASWQPALPSGDKGPRYRCLAMRDGVLYACAAGELLGDEAMVLTSRDEGRSWAPLVRLEHLGSARSCVKSRCVQTEMWLCENYQQCAPGLMPTVDAGGGPADAGAPDARDGSVKPAPPRESSGCALAGTPPASPASAWLLVAAAFALLTTASRRGSRHRPAHHRSADGATQA